MTVLLTGCAGFVGHRVGEMLLARGETVVGVDNLNAYYDPSLKRARLDRLRTHRAFSFVDANIADRAAMAEVRARHPDVRLIVHLAAQPGVRHSLVDPYVYVESNVLGHLTILEEAWRYKNLQHVVYASSSSVYGGNAKVPFSIEDPVESPRSLYAVTKRTDELMSEAYVHLRNLKITGLRLFTVYGPWGRPDMSPWIFCRKILAGDTIPIFNFGMLKRDFTYVDDVAAGVMAAVDRPPAAPAHRVYNIGASRSEDIMHMVRLLEQATGRTAQLDLQPAQPGDLAETCADLTLTERELGWAPTTPLDVGVPRFVDWYREYHRL
jgi:UDP-glucuronate 4-epimerase